MNKLKITAFATAVSILCSIAVSSSYSFKDAKTYKSGKRISAKLDFAGDEDVFKIKAKKSGKMVIKVSNNDVGDDLFSKLEYTIYNKSKVAKANEIIKKTITGKKTIKVKKGQVVYVKVKMSGSQFQYRLGGYSISTKIK